MGAENPPYGSAEVKRRGRPPLGDRAKDAEIHVRVDERGRRAIDRRRRPGESRAAWVRRAVAFAHAHMPDGWDRPGDPVPALVVEREEHRGPDLRAERFTDAP